MKSSNGKFSVSERARRAVWCVCFCLAPIASPGQDSEVGVEAEEAQAAEDLSLYDALVFDRPIPLTADLSDDPASYSARYLERSEQPTYQARMRNIQSYEQDIQDLEFQGGAWDPGLAEPLNDLAEIYAEQGSHELAVDAYARAMHVSRVNTGLDNLDQIPSVERMIESYLAMGAWDKADQYQNYLYYTQKKAFGPDDPRMVPVLDRLASWNLSVFNARWGEAVGLRLPTAFYLFRSASRIVSVHFGEEDERYTQYLRDTAATAYLISRYETLIEEASRPEYNSAQAMFTDQLYKVRPVTDRGYQEGLQALELVVEYYAEHEPLSADHARALVHEADWYLLFERRRTAESKYGEAAEILAALENGEVLIQEMFGSVIPLPQFSERVEEITFTADVENRVRNARVAGYIDVEFDVTAYGAVVDLDVLTEDDAIDSRVFSSLRRSIRATVFRPRFENGELVRAENNRFRYPYWY